MQQRKIAFRAWDEIRKEMIAPTSVCLWDNGVIEVMPCYSDSKYTLLQFTGLHDKNGKEIYEGDILSLGNSQWEVQWISSDAGFWLVDIPTKTLLMDEKPIGRLNLGMICDEAEIIGNIYES